MQMFSYEQEAQRNNFKGEKGTIKLDLLNKNYPSVN